MDLFKLLVVMCGFGVIVCYVVLGVYFCGKLDVFIYDGFWVEWYMCVWFEDVILEGWGKIY